MGQFIDTCHLFCLETKCHVSQMHSKKENYLSWCNPSDPQTTFSTPRPLPSFPTGIPLCSQDSTLRWHRFLKLQTFSSAAFNTCNNWPLSFSQSVVLGKFFLYNLLFFCLSVSLPSLQNQGSLPSAVLTSLFTPKSQHCPFCPPQCATFLPPVVFFQNSELSLGVQNDNYLVVFKGETSIKSSYYSTILSPCFCL